VAIVDDIKRDRRTKNVLAQTNTKTVSVPSPDTGLVGDQTPAEVFSVDDFDLVKNQVHLEEENFQLMEALNVMGQITNMQSQSGPIPGTQKIISVTSTTQGTFVWDRPPAGQVWALLAANVAEDDSSYHNIYISDGTTEVFVAQETSATRYDPFPGLPLYYTYDNYLAYGIPTSPGGGNNTIVGTVIRVR